MLQISGGNRCMICHLCGNEIDLRKEATAVSDGQAVHLDCLHDIVCPHEEMERL